NTGEDVRKPGEAARVGRLSFLSSECTGEGGSAPLPRGTPKALTTLQPGTYSRTAVPAALLRRTPVAQHHALSQVCHSGHGADCQPHLNACLNGVLTGVAYDGYSDTSIPAAWRRCGSLVPSRSSAGAWNTRYGRR